MKVVARHRYAPLVQLDDGTIIDTEDLEVVGNGDVSGDSWEMSPEMEIDSRWEEIARADAANLGVTERKFANGPRTFRAPSHVRNALEESPVETPLVEGKGLTLDELGALVEDDNVTGPAEDWMFGILNKHEDNPDAEEEASLFSEAESDLDYDEIDSAMDDDEDDSLIAAVEPPPGDFTKVVYIAIIEEDDQKSVQELVALVQTKDGAAGAFKYGDKGWEESQAVLTQLQAPAPPPIQQLEDWQTESILAQIASTSSLSNEAKAEPWEDTPTDAVHAQPENPDGPQETVQASAFEDLPEGGVIWGPDNRTILSVILAAGPGGAQGGADRNRGGAEILRRYWTVGKGGAKIRWNTPGDWTRCRRHLSKYLGPRAAGYCQLRHKEMTGMWTGDRAHRALRAAADDGHVWHPRQGGMTIQEQMARDKAGGSTPSRGSTRLGTRDGGTGTAKGGTKSKSGGSSGGSSSGGHDRAHNGGNSTAARSARAYGRQPAGASGGVGGQFAPGKARNAEAAKAQKDPVAMKLYNDIMNQDSAQVHATMAKLSDKELIALCRILYSDHTSDKGVVARRLSVASEMAKRGYDVKDFGALGGGIDSDKGKGQFNEPLTPGTGTNTSTTARTITQLKTDASKTKSGGLPVATLTETERKKLLTSGWKGDPTDGEETLYPPVKTSAAPTQMQKALANWPKNWGPKPPSTSPGGAPIASALQDGSATYEDGTSYSPTDKRFKTLPG